MYKINQTVKTVYGDRALIISIEAGYSYELENGETFAKSTMYICLINGERRYIHETKVLGVWK